MGFEDKIRLPFIARPDLSPFVVHLTKGSKDGTTGFDNLVKILKAGRLVGSKPGWARRGFIKGSTPAACFMDVPLGSLKYVINRRDAKRYEPYGIVISKETAYRKGARPVLYLSDLELAELEVPRKHYWRVVKFEGVTADKFGWTHQREWRAAGDFKLPTELFAVLVKTTHEAARLMQLLVKQPELFKSLPRSVLPLSIVCQGLPYLKEP